MRDLASLQLSQACNSLRMYDCVVVNLDRRGDRWINTLLRLIAAGLPCSRLPAADGAKHNAAALLQARESIVI